MKKTMKELRKEKRFTQRELSEVTGINYDAIVCYDNMYREPPVTRGLKIAAALKADPYKIQWKAEEDE